MHWQRVFLEAQLGIGCDSSSLPQSPAEHVLVAAVQMRPVVSASQSLSPQAQSDGLGAVPSMVAQVGNWLHLFWDRSQCIPVVSAPVHALFPQMQGAALLGADPSVFVQAGAVRVHMHVRVVVQDAVEEVSVLKIRLLKEYL